MLDLKSKQLFPIKKNQHRMGRGPVVCKTFQHQVLLQVYCSAMVDYTIENSGDKCKNGTSKDDNGDDSVVVVTEKPPAMEKKCDRIYHLYRVKSLNAMLIVAEAPRSAATATGAYDEFSDRPVEGE